MWKFQMMQRLTKHFVLVDNYVLWNSYVQWPVSSLFKIRHSFDVSVTLAKCQKGWELLSTCLSQNISDTSRFTKCKMARHQEVKLLVGFVFLESRLFSYLLALLHFQNVWLSELKFDETGNGLSWFTGASHMTHTWVTIGVWVTHHNTRRDKLDEQC